MKKKLLSLLLVLALSISLLGGSALAADSDAPFELVATLNAEDKTVTLSLKTTRQMEYGNIDSKLIWPEGFSLTEIAQGKDYSAFNAQPPVSYNVTGIASVITADVWNGSVVESDKEFLAYTIDASSAAAGEYTFSVQFTSAVNVEVETLPWENATITSNAITILADDAETYISVNGDEVSYTEIEAKMASLSETTKTYYTGSTDSPTANPVTAQFLPINSLVETPAGCGYTVAAGDTSKTLAASDAYVYFDDGVLRSAVDGSRGNAWLSGITTITSVDMHSYEDGVCTVCGEADPDYTAAAYTVTLTPSATEVAPGGTVDVNVVVSGADFNAYDITVTYDSTLFSTTDDVSFYAYNGDYESGDTVATLTFTAVSDITETATGAFGVSKALIGVAGEGQALDRDAEAAATVGTSVTIKVTTYTVTFKDADGAELDTVIVNEGEKVAIGDIPTPAAPEHYEFAGWNDGTGTAYTNAQVAELAVTADVTYTATYAAKEYDVTFNDSELNAPATATYGENYEGTVKDYDSNYDYTVIATFEGGAEQEYDVDANGSFTIPGEDITSDMTLTVSKTLSGVTATVYGDYVAGYSLVVVHGGADGYVYNGNAMYRTDYYDADTTDTTDKAFAYIIEGTTTADDVLDALTVGTAAGTITASYDVNATGKIDINDAQAVADCYNVRGTMATYMPVYLRADVDANHIVNSADAELVLVNRA